MRIAIDIRKFNDFGIGTYIRNLIRQLGRIDKDTGYVLVCRPQDRDQIAVPADNFRLVADPSLPYSIAEQFRIPVVLRREHIDLFHAPHYVLPPLIHCRSVVTIHDCIHLMFPQYLPNRFAYAYAKAQLWTAAHRSDRILTVSEASKLDILRRFHVPADKVTVVYNAIDERLAVPPDAEESERVRARYQLKDPFALYVGNIKPHKNLERLIDAFHQLRQESAFESLKLVIIGDEISEVPGAAAGGSPLQAAQARPVLRVRAARHPVGALPHGERLRLPVALRRIRPSAAGGDVFRHPGGDIERLVAPRGGR